MPRPSALFSCARRTIVLLSAITPTGWLTVILMVLGALVVAGPGRVNFVRAPAQVLAAANPVAEPASAGSWLPTESMWGEQLRATTFSSSRGSGGTGAGVSFTPALRNGLTRTLPDDFNTERSSIPLRSKDRWPVADGEQGGGKTYRTMCVRLCDGYYWPINYAVTKDKLGDDAMACARSCGGPNEARLFSYRNPGGEIEEMEDSDGKAYRKLQNAFLFRTKYESSCKCRPHPWEEASTDRHKTYSLMADAQKGDRLAAQKLSDLRAKLRVEAQAALKAKAEASRGKLPAKAAAPPSSANKIAAADATEAAAATPSLAPVATKTIQKVRIIRGDQKQTGAFRAGNQTFTPTVPVDRAMSEQTRVVRLRMGANAVQSVPVAPKTMQKSAGFGDLSVLQR